MSDKMRPSRLEIRLEAEISNAQSVLDADCKRAELAAYHVRLGRVAEVERTLRDLRQRYKVHPNVAISAWLNLVEGLVGHFGDMDAGARDKILRAHALSSAAGLVPMKALSAAWLAHFDYAVLDIEAASAHVRSSIACSNVNDDSVRSRASLVIAQILHLAGRYDVAKPWYIKARFHANRDGDNATIGAVLSNMTWLHMSNFRQTYFLKDIILPHDLNILLSAESARNFDRLFNVNTFANLEPVLRAQIFSLRGQWIEALALYDSYFSSATSKSAFRFSAILLADQAWCRLQVGNKSRVREDALVVIQHLHQSIQIDECAATHSRLFEIFSEVEYFDEMKRHRELAKSSWGIFLALQKRIIELFEGIQ